MGIYKIQAADQEELMGDDDPKHIFFPIGNSKIVDGSQSPRGSKRLVFYQKLGQFEWIFSSTAWKSNSATGQPRMVPTVWHRKNGGGRQGEKT